MTEIVIKGSFLSDPEIVEWFRRTLSESLAGVDLVFLKKPGEPEEPEPTA